MDTLPNYENAVVPLDKLLKYSLDYDNPKNNGKAYAFEFALGFNKNNYQELLRQVREALPLYKAVERGYNKYGDLYQVVMTINGTYNRQAEVLTGWIIEYGDDFPRLTSIYVTDKKGVKL
ncbi:MAG: hypothetical protein LBM98_01005 [Oscillospiraceae bacterium]|nr:hypothetical protein [Oscillospiraceae bacterium]